MSANPPELPYTLGKWGEFTTWQCKLCPWDTLVSVEDFFQHLLRAHPFRDPEPPKTLRLSYILDQFGKPLVVEDRTEGDTK
jgi:hypothetical protein